MMMFFHHATLITIVVTMIMQQSDGAPDPEVKYDVKVDIDGETVFHKKHPNGQKGTNAYYSVFKTEKSRMYSKK